MAPVMSAQQNPVHLIHNRRILDHILELMHQRLSPLEKQLVLLHCGMYTGQPVRFSRLAEVFRLASPAEAEALYRQAVIRTREAIAGSALENWLVCYQLTYHAGKVLPLEFVHRPIPVWTTEPDAP